MFCFSKIWPLKSSSIQWHQNLNLFLMFLLRVSKCHCSFHLIGLIWEIFKASADLVECWYLLTAFCRQLLTYFFSRTGVAGEREYIARRRRGRRAIRLKTRKIASVCVCVAAAWCKIWRRILGQGGWEEKGWDSKTPDRRDRLLPTLPLFSINLPECSVVLCRAVQVSFHRSTRPHGKI